MEVIADVDYVIEIGPDDGEAGWQLLYQGDVAGLKKTRASVTARVLWLFSTLSNWRATLCRCRRGIVHRDNFS